ncbi:hypothetical protein [Rhabdothermincola sp.]|uniref:hypothetical protein n=1 Tax=Rhabdothermincola sp. TaxID=2820405 RepID=UPI002FE20EB2
MANVRRGGLGIVAVLAVPILLSACSSGGGGQTATTTSTAARQPSATTAPPPSEPAGVIVFNGQGNHLDAYAAEPPFEHQRVITSRSEDPEGLDINGQICFFPDGSGRFVAGEDTGQTAGDTQGWGIFELTGDRIGDLRAREIGKLVPTFQGSADNAENYGCGFLSDGRIVTTDVGNQAAGPGDGQLIVWFPPFDSREVTYCKVDVEIATAQSIWVDDQDRVLVASARPTSFGGQTSGVWRYHDLPTGPDAAGGCGRTDATGAPLADEVRKEMFIPSGEHDLIAPTGVTGGPDGHLFVSSVINGVINEYDANGVYLRTILRPPAGEQFGAQPFSTGTPLGIAAGPDGTIYYADIGLVLKPDGGIGPGDKTGSVRRIVFVAGEPQPPETMARGLAFPDGIGLLVPGAGGGGASRL